MTTTMNPIGLYHDPALDGSTASSDQPRRNQSARRDGSQPTRTGQPMINAPHQLPEAPNPPVTSPTSYRNPPADVPGTQRSFSQRAKTRPFADEAFDGDDGTMAPQATSRRRYVEGDVPDQPRRSKNRSSGGVPLQINTANTNGAQVVRSPVEQTPAIVRDGSTRQRAQRNTDVNRHIQEPLSATNRSSAMAPDRSPLQKLEVTLNDISKEEKRARVQEAEMQYMARREQERSETNPEIARRTSSRRTANQPREQAHVDGAGVSRSVSNTEQRTRQQEPVVNQNRNNTGNVNNNRRLQRQQDTPVETSSNDIQLPSSSNNQNLHRQQDRNGGVTRSQGQPNSIPQAGYEYIDAAGRSAEDTQIPAQRTRSKHAAPIRQQDPVTAQIPTHQIPARTKNVSRSVSAREPSGPSLATPVDMSATARAVTVDVPATGRAVSLDQTRSSGRTVDTENSTRVPGYDDLHRNASHKAALRKLTGDDAPVVSPTAGPRKLQKKTKSQQQSPTIGRDSEPMIQESAAVRSATRNLDTTHQQKSPSIEQQWSEIQRGPSQRGPPPAAQVGLGLENSHTGSDGRPLVNSGDGTNGRQRKSSVSFKEPMDRRPVDEWKNAGVAHLSAADFVLEKSGPSTQDKTWWEQSDTTGSRRKRQSGSYKSANHIVEPPIDDRQARCDPPLFIRCGPLLRYTGIKRTPPAANTDRPGAATWRGSVMIVTADSQSTYGKLPVLRLFSRPKTLLPPPPAKVTTEELAPEYVDPIAGLTKMSRVGRALYVRPIDHLEEGKDLSRIENDDGLFEISPSPLDIPGDSQATAASTNKRTTDIDGEHVGKFREVQGSRVYADPDRGVTFWRFNIEIELGEQQQHVAYRINRGVATGFWVPGRDESMNIMFHSCNGFSMSVNPDEFNGPDPMWRDVLNTHQTRPFHVMLGGGDQIYNDRVMVETRHFGEWTRMRNPTHKHHAPFSTEMKEELESYYLDRYAMWFSQGLFGMANSQIPMVNIWDDHDIIDGFGSYPEHLMKSPVFSGIGNIAFKYYMLFQHQSVPTETMAEEPSWLIGKAPGPYINQLSRSVYLSLGKHLAFLGLDCRTERKRDEILSLDTLDIVLERLRKELVEGETKHLLLLLGVPIAYPRLVWLENVLTSRAMDPIKAMGRAGILKGGFLNKFDGGVEILDDLDDHWTSKNHKAERNDFVKDLQDLAAEKSCRITILSGDVHLGAVGQFYSNPKLRIPKDRDHRYMPNIISSAIVNTPPPDMMADVLNKRNKIHHLDEYTDENMIPLFTHDVDKKRRNNKRLLPRRNWCAIREYHPGTTPPPTPPESEHGSEVEEYENSPRPAAPKRRFSLTKDDMNPRNIFRRNKSGNAPPTSFRGQANNPHQFRSASYDGTSQDHPFDQRSEDSNSRRPSISSLQNGNRRAASFDQSSTTAARPSMFRRLPTNVSEKAARKGDVPHIDEEGNEIYLNDQINLEGGLDVVLNMEVDRTDPSGITLPYRLLVPALWYDGSSDREKLDGMAKDSKRPGIFKRMSLVGKPAQRGQPEQVNELVGATGADKEIFSGSDEGAEPAPRRKFGFLSRFRGRRDDYSDESFSDVDEDGNSIQHSEHHDQGQHMQQQFPSPNAQQSYQQNRNQQDESGEKRLSFHQQVTGQSPVRPSFGQTASHPNGSDYLYDASNPPPQRQVSQTQKSNGPQRSVTISSQRSVPESVSAQPAGGYQPSTPPRSQSQRAGQQTNNHQSPLVPQQRQSSKQARVLGIGSTRDMYQEPQQTQLRGDGIIGGGDAPSQSTGQSSKYYRQRDYDDYSDEGEEQPRHKNRLQFFKPGRLSNQYDPSNQPPQVQHAASQHDQYPQQSQPQQPSNRPRTWYDEEPQMTMNQNPTANMMTNTNSNTRPELGQTHSSTYSGYDGIEAYKAPKPKRRWSLRKATRDWLEGGDRNRYAAQYPDAQSPQDYYQQGPPQQQQAPQHYQ